MRTQGYLDLFRHRDFRALWVGSALGIAATTMSSLTLGSLVYAQTNSALLTVAAMFGPSLVQVVGATTMMSAADTTPPRPVLSLISGVMAVALILQAAFTLSAGTRLVIVLSAAFVMSVGNGVRWGLLSEVLRPDRYALARSAMNISVGVMQIVGFAVGGTLLHLLGGRQTFWLAAAVAALAVPVLWFGIEDHHPRRTSHTGILETWRGNRLLLQLPSTRPLLMALCVPNGLIAGCEALFVPYAKESAAALFVTTAVGMLAGDLVMGRALNESHRRKSAVWLRLWLPVPFLVFVVQPGVTLAAILAGTACLGYAASLAQQEMLVRLTPPSLAGQLLGVDSAARVTCQGLGALLAGTVAETVAVGNAIALLALGSMLASLALTPALARVSERVTNPPSREQPAGPGQGHRTSILLAAAAEPDGRPSHHP
jgi:predicted MFS family arabinose efflux permease